ncbi:MATE family efflux transporter [Gayadomonas joobiniege]|uniref:MATE family efflux transporter n=1 Tax=Gayadomonas joobiniege TaxID=1234606 RepID=UPI000377B6A1|nr:MATE family efflux transporter [Gayadomonas joobiniege]
MNRATAFYLRKNIKLAWPMALNAILMQAMLVIDTLLVAPLGELSVAAMGISVTIVAFVLGVQLALANGSQLIISRAFGAKNSLRLHQSALYSAAINLLAGIAFILLLNGSQNHFLPLLSDDSEVIILSKNYLFIAQFIFIFNALSQTLIAFLNAQGQTRLPFNAYLFEVPINIVLSYSFIFVLEMGLVGAAYGSLAAIIFRCAYLTIKIIERRYQFLAAAKSPEHCRQLHQHFTEIFPIAINFILLSIGNTLYLLLFSQLNLYEYVAVTLLFPWLKMATLFIVAWAQANAISISQAIGRAKKQHLNTIIKSCLLAGFAMAFGVALALYVFSLLIQSIYPELAAQTYTAIASITALFVLLPIVRTFNTIAGNSLRAMGSSLQVLKIHFICQWLITLPLCAIFVLYLKLPLFWAFALLPLEEILKLGPFYYLLRRNTVS